MIAFCIFVAGALMLAQGLSIEHQAESAMHQIFSGIYVAGGVVTMALALVVRSIDGVWDEAKAVRTTLKEQIDARAKAESEQKGRLFREQEAERSAARDRAAQATNEAVPPADDSPKSLPEKKPYVWGSVMRSSAGGSRPCPNCGHDVQDEQAICECGYGFTR